MHVPGALGDETTECSGRENEILLPLTLYVYTVTHTVRGTTLPAVRVCLYYR